MVHDVAHELVRAAWNEQVNGLVACQQLAYFLACLNLVQATLGKTGLDGRSIDYLKQGSVGTHRLATTLEQSAVAAFEAERGDLHERVGACLKDDANDADGAGLAHEHELLVELAAQLDSTDGVGQGHEILYSLAHALELRLVELEPFDDGRSDTVLLGSIQVGGVGGKDLVTIVEQRLANTDERFISLLERRGRHHGALELHVGGNLCNRKHGTPFDGCASV